MSKKPEDVVIEMVNPAGPAGAGRLESAASSASGLQNARGMNRAQSFLSRVIGKKSKTGDGAASSGTGSGPRGLRVMAKMAKWSANSRHKVLANNTGIPLREGLQVLYKIRRAKFLWELVIFATFFLLFLGIVYEAYDVHTSFEQDDTLIELFLDEEFPGAQFKKNFHEINTLDDIWEFLNGPVLNGLFPTEWYNGKEFAETERGYLLHYLRLVGKPQLRQMRVSNASCFERRFTKFGDRFDTKDGTCFAEFTLGNFYTKSTELTEPFGPPEDPTRYKHTPSGLGRLWGLYNFGPSDYGDGGYVRAAEYSHEPGSSTDAQVVYLDLDRKNATRQIEQLYNDTWVDRGTRAVALTFNVYNTNTRMLTVARMVIEFSPSAYILGSFTFFTVRLVLYQSRTGMLRAVLELVYVILWLYQVQKEVKRFRWTHPHIDYFLQFRNIFEVGYLMLNLGVMVMWFMYGLDSTRQNFDVNSEEYVNFFEMGYNFLVAFSFAGFNCLFSCLKLFKFLSLNKRTNTLWLTLQRASYDLVMFMIGFAFIVAGFGFTGNLLFGHMLKDFHSIMSSISSLTRFMLGDFNYENLSTARPQVAPIFFWLYNGVVFLVILNMFIAIITSYFEEVHREAKVSDRWKEGMPDLSFDFLKALRRLCRNYVKNRCGCVYRCCCMLTCRGRGRGKVGHKPRTASGLELQIEVWDREASFEKVMRMAARAAKMRHRSLDLFLYFEHAYRESRDLANFYIGLDELCTITRDAPTCSHDDCLARQLVLSYTHLKEVVLLRGQERTSGSIALAQRKNEKFHVTKINKWGRKQDRILAIDEDKMELHGFDRHMNLKRILPISQLLQIDKSVVDKRRVNLVFSEGVATQYHLLFVNGAERQNFCDKILKVVNRLDDAESRRQQWQQSLRAPKKPAVSILAAATQSAAGDSKLAPASADLPPRHHRKGSDASDRSDSPSSDLQPRPGLSGSQREARMSASGAGPAPVRKRDSLQLDAPPLLTGLQPTLSGSTAPSNTTSAAFDRKTVQTLLASQQQLEDQVQSLQVSLYTALDVLRSIDVRTSGVERYKSSMRDDPHDF